MSDPDYEPDFKRSKLSKCESKCLICREQFNSEDEVRSPSSNHLKIFLDLVYNANDTVSERTRKKESEILSGKLKISYHKNCRSLYNPSKTDKEESDRRESQRLKVPSFKWKENCMICGKPCDRNHQRDS